MPKLARAPRPHRLRKSGKVASEEQASGGREGRLVGEVKCMRGGEDLQGHRAMRIKGPSKRGCFLVWQKSEDWKIRVRVDKPILLWVRARCRHPHRQDFKDDHSPLSSPAHPPHTQLCSHARWVTTQGRKTQTSTVAHAWHRRRLSLTGAGGRERRGTWGLCNFQSIFLSIENCSEI